jgi:hypothetical protein
MATEGDRSTAEPKTVREGLGGEYGDKWLDSMDSGIKEIELKGTWIETLLPEGRKDVDCKWIYKADADGKVVKYKSRLVAQGFSQIPGIDYEQTFTSRTLPLGSDCSVKLYSTHSVVLGLKSARSGP